MSIIECAIKLNNVVKNIARERGISKEEAWVEGVKVYKEEYENIKN